MNDEEKNQYEIGFLAKEEDSSLVKRLLEKHSASVVNEGSVVKVNLAYPIKKDSQAFFGYLKFEMAPANVGELEKELKLESTLLRFLLIKLPILSADESRIGPIKPLVRRRERRPEGAPSGPVLTNEALEKKIEEILQ